MKKLFLLCLTLSFVLFFTFPAAADVMWTPFVYIAVGLRYWPVVLLVAAVIILTVILIKKLKK